MKAIAIKVKNIDTIDKNYIFAETNCGERVFVHRKNFFDPIDGSVFFLKRPTYNIATHEVAILTKDQLVHQYHTLYAIVESGEKGLFATNIHLTKKGFIKSLKKHYNLSEFENSDIIAEARQQLDNDRWSRMLN